MCSESIIGLMRMLCEDPVTRMTPEQIRSTEIYLRGIQNDIGKIKGNKKQEFTKEQLIRVDNSFQEIYKHIDKLIENIPIENDNDKI